jgi:3',5'-cyclic AMP phosphodiesterase CpdA
VRLLHNISKPDCWTFVVQDVGNRPTKASIERFTSEFGDDYLAFWVNGTYNIVLNTNLIADPSGAEDLFARQLHWLKDRLAFARKNKASQIFLFGHHPWFLYHEDEEADDLKEFSTLLKLEGPDGVKTIPIPVPVSYFHIPKKHRSEFIQLFKEYNVSAAFSGHFHQNVVSKASFGMDMIVTSSLSVVLDSTGKTGESNSEPSSRGVRIVDVGEEENAFSHRFISLPE